MKVMYDVDIKEHLPRSKFQEEYNALQNFINSNHSSMRMEYEESDEHLLTVYGTMYKYIERHNMPITIKKRGKSLIILRKDDKK